MARRAEQEVQETRQYILDMALRFFSQQEVSPISPGEIAEAAGAARDTICWHFKNKSDLFGEIWKLSESNIGELELEYRAKFPDDPLSVLREILIHVLESTVAEKRRRLLMEIIFHKCEFIREMAVVQRARRNFCLESYDRIEQVLKYRIEAKMSSANLMARRTVIIMRGYVPSLVENWLFALQSLNLKEEARDYVAILLEMYLLRPTLRNPATNE